MRAEPIAGRCELVEEIKSGGMGTVWRGYDSVLDRQVAIKLVRPGVVSAPEQADEFAKRFRREARLTARIGHHGVPQVYDAVLDLPYDRVYLVMELVTGTPMRAYIDPAAPLPVAWAAAIAAQIATVLSHAHAIPAVHRDLKPDNVLVTEPGAVKLIDFGIAAILRTDITRLTATGTPMGTTRYMSPEQNQGGQITPSCDLYALGCILHELLTGAHAVTGDNEFAMMQQHVSGAPTPVRSLRPDAPKRWNSSSSICSPNHPTNDRPTRTRSTSACCHCSRQPAPNLLQPARDRPGCPTRPASTAGPTRPTPDRTRRQNRPPPNPTRCSTPGRHPAQRRHPDESHTPLRR